jgi:hypothetical protein
VAEAVTGLELFAFVVLPVAVGASAWGVVLVAERRRALAARRAQAKPPTSGRPAAPPNVQRLPRNRR